MASKVGSVALAPGLAFSTRRATSSSCGLGLGGTLPLPSMQPGGWSAEAEPSVTTNDTPKGVGIVVPVMIITRIGTALWRCRGKYFGQQSLCFIVRSYSSMGEPDNGWNRAE